METNKIEGLLDKYYNGMTSKEEENVLLRFFSQENVPDNMKDEKAFFVTLHNNIHKNSNIPQRLERNLETLIDSFDKTLTTVPSSRRRPTLRLGSISGIAASVIAVASLGIYLHGRNQITQADKAALAQAQQALVEFSTTLNKGLEQMEAAQKRAANISDKLSKCIEINKNDE